jgi:PEP-CTERM motif
MRKTRTLAFSCAALATAWLTAAAPAAAQTLSGVRITPDNATAADLITAQVDGFFPTSGFSFIGDPGVSITGQAITIRLLAQGPSGTALTVLVPFSVPVGLGLLPEGDYTETVNVFLVDSPVAKASYSGSFSVAPAAPVPEPATALLLGLGLAVFLRRRTQRPR